MKILIAMCLLSIYIIFAPILLIWSLNTLFTLNILYTFNNWLAAYILIAFLNLTLSNHQTNADK